MKLDPKGLEAAREQPGTNHDGIIRAYLTALTPAEVGVLVERLQHRAVSEDDAIALIDDDLAEAASLIQSQAARISALALHEKIASSHPSLRRGKVWCRSCGTEQEVDPAGCLRNGWPKCCGHTMTIDHPDTWKVPSHDH